MHGHAEDMFSQLTVTTVLESCSWYPALFIRISDDPFLAQEQWLVSKGKNRSTQLQAASTHIGPYTDV